MCQFPLSDIQYPAGYGIPRACNGNAQMIGNKTAESYIYFLVCHFGLFVYFQAQLQQAEHLLSTESAEEPSSLSMLVILLKAQYYYITGQVNSHLPHMLLLHCSVPPLSLIEGPFCPNVRWIVGCLSCVQC